MAVDDPICFCDGTWRTAGTCALHYYICNSTDYVPRTIVYNLSIFREWLRLRPLTALYRLPRLFQRRVRWIERRAEPRWRAGRWKAKT